MEAELGVFVGDVVRAELVTGVNVSSDENTGGVAGKK